MSDDPNNEQAVPGPVMQRVGRPKTARFQRPLRPNLDEPERPEGDPIPRGLKRGRSRKNDKFSIPAHEIPRGWSYEWKRQSCYGMEDRDNIVNMRENHWRAVPASRHPQLMPTGWEGAIEKDGMVLMERPAYLTEEARQEDYEIAMEAVQGASRGLVEAPGGTFTRDHPSVRNSTYIRKSYTPMTPPMTAEE